MATAMRPQRGWPWVTNGVPGNALGSYQPAGGRDDAEGLGLQREQRRASALANVSD